MRRILLLTALSLAFAIGCGDTKHASNLEETGGTTSKGGKTGKGGSSSKGGSSGEAGNAGGGAGGNGGNGGNGGDSGGTAGNAGVVNAPGAPVVTFVSPASVLDPNAAGVITTETVTVTCKAVAAAEPGSTVETATTAITMSQNGTAITSGQTSSLMVNGAREVEFALTDTTGVESGLITFDCSAEDDSSPALVGTAPELNLLVDRGPAITLTQPSEKQNIALSAGVDVEFTISANEIAAGDEKYPLDKYTVTINGKEVTIAETAPGSGRYKGHVALTDPVLFPPGDTPDGATTLQVVAVNKRGTTVQKTTTFSVDSTPPKITIANPKPNSIVGKSTTISFSVTDSGSGVDPSTVGVRINAGTIFYYAATDAARWQHVSGTELYNFTFSDNDFPTSETQTTVSIFATDKVRNSIAPGATLSLFVDTQPPYVSLDPPTVRDIYYSELYMTEVCSTAFDPVGEAINDLTIDNGVDTFRALVWDLANQPRDSNLIRYYSSVDPKNVTLYLQENLDEPLLIDSDGDGYCDNVDIGTGNTRKVALKLDPISKAGIPPHELADTADDTRYATAPPITGICQRNGFLPSSPWPYLCSSTSDMVRVIHHSVTSSTPIPAIFGVAPVAGDSDVGCTGTYWEYFHDMKRTVTDGWLCFVAVAYDGVGNRGVSAPLRVCYDDPTTTAKPTCAESTQPLDTTFLATWNSYIRHGFDDKPFRAKSAETPPSCAKSCTLRSQNLSRFITNQEY